MGQRNTIGQTRNIARRRRGKTPPDRNATRQSKSSANKKSPGQFKSETQQEMQVMAEI